MKSYTTPEPAHFHQSKRSCDAVCLGGFICHDLPEGWYFHRGGVRAFALGAMALKGEWKSPLRV